MKEVEHRRVSKFQFEITQEKIILLLRPCFKLIVRYKRVSAYRACSELY